MGCRHLGKRKLCGKSVWSLDYWKTPTITLTLYPGTPWIISKPALRVFLRRHSSAQEKGTQGPQTLAEVQALYGISLNLSVVPRVVRSWTSLIVSLGLQDMEPQEFSEVFGKVPL